MSNMNECRILVRYSIHHSTFSFLNMLNVGLREPFNVNLNVAHIFSHCTLVFAGAPHIGSSVSSRVARWPARLRYLEHSIQQILPRAMKSATQQGTTSQQCETTNRDPRISDGHGGCVSLSLESPLNLPRISLESPSCRATSRAEHGRGAVSGVPITAPMVTRGPRSS